MIKHLNIKVYGKVQNVGFRFYTNKRANILGVKGYVKNMPDKSVYIEAEATEFLMEQFLEFVNEGPKWSRVSEVKTYEAPIKGFENFEIR